MNSVPIVFINAVSRLVNDYNLDKIQGHFGDVSIACSKDNFNIYVEIVYRHPADTVHYRIFRSLQDECMPYKFEASEYQFIDFFNVEIYSENPGTYDDCPWTLAKLTDRKLRTLLRASFDFLTLEIDENDEYECAKILALLPDYFNGIHADCKYNETLDKIIRKSNDEKRLDDLKCPQFFNSRTVEELVQFIMSNERLNFAWQNDGFYTCLAESSLFELWINQPEMFTRDFGFNVNEPDALRHLSKYSFEPISQCDCCWLEENWRFDKDEDVCLHFSFDHPSAPAKRVLLTVLSEDPVIEEVISLIQAADHKRELGFILFKC